jgi:FkbM family methyltransferase
MTLDERKAAVVIAAEAGRDAEVEACQASVERAWRTSSGAFETLDLVHLTTPDGQTAAVRNAGIQAAMDGQAAWLLHLDAANHRLHPEAFQTVTDQRGDADALWGLKAGWMAGQDEFNVSLPQVLTLDDLREYLLFPPNLTLESPFFIRTEPAAAVWFNPNLAEDWDLDFILRFWSRFRVRKVPSVLAGSLQPEDADEARREARLEQILTARRDMGLVRETPVDVEIMNRKAQQLQQLCREQHPIPAELVAELAALMPYRGFLDVNLAENRGFILFVNNDDPVALEMAWRGNYHPLAGALWAALVGTGADGKLVLDVGSFNGLFGLIAAVVAPSAHVVCFEPEAEAHARLTVNLNANQLMNLNAARAAMAAAPGAGSLYRLGRGSGLQPMATLRPHRNFSFQDGQPVNVFTLDAFFQSVTTADETPPEAAAIKIDACGMEADVVVGGSDTLAAHRPDLLVTLHPESDLARLNEVLTPLDYALYVVDEDHSRIQPARLGELKVAGPARVLATTKNRDALQQLLAAAGLV